MSLYQCEKCGNVENTSNGFYWSRHMDMWPEEYRGKELCLECGPPTYADGRPSDFGRKQPKGTYLRFPVGSLYTDREGNVRFKDTNEYPKSEDALKD